MLTDADRWQSLARNGLAGVKAHEAWQVHAGTYLQQVANTLEKMAAPQSTAYPGPVHHRDRVIIIELDQLLRGDPSELRAFSAAAAGAPQAHRVFGIAMRRGLEATLRLVKQHSIPTPDVITATLGTEL